jgi:hypothetical protein
MLDLLRLGEWRVGQNVFEACLAILRLGA